MGRVIVKQLVQLTYKSYKLELMDDVEKNVIN